MKDFVFFSFFNNLDSKGSQYRIVLTKKVKTFNFIEFDDIVKDLKNYERTLKNDVENSTNAIKNNFKKVFKRGFKNDFEDFKRNSNERQGDFKTCDCYDKKNHMKNECKKKNLICHNCGKINHIKSICRSKLKDFITSTTLSNEKKNIICRAIVLSPRNLHSAEIYKEFQNSIDENETIGWRETMTHTSEKQQEIL